MSGPFRRLGVIGTIAVVATGCGGSPNNSADATTPTTMSPLTTVATTTTVPSLDPGLVQDCVDYVQFGAFTGNGLLRAMWDQAGASAASLRTTCEELGRSDAQTLVGMSAQWQEIQRFLAASSTTTAPTTATPTTAATTATPTTAATTAAPTTATTTAP